MTKTIDLVREAGGRFEFRPIDLPGGGAPEAGDVAPERLDGHLAETPDDVASAANPAQKKRRFEAMGEYAAEMLPDPEYEVRRATAVQAIRMERAKVPEGETARVIDLLLAIAQEEERRPVWRGVVSYPMLALMAGIKEELVHREGEIRSLLDRLVPLLEYVPKTYMVPRGGKATVSNPFFIGVRDKLRAHLIAGGTLPSRRRQPTRHSVLGAAQVLNCEPEEL